MVHHAARLVHATVCGEGTCSEHAPYMHVRMYVRTYLDTEIGIRVRVVVHRVQGLCISLERSLQEEQARRSTIILIV